MKLVQKIQAHKDRVWQLTWSPKKLLFASCSGDKCINVYRFIQNFELVKSVDAAHTRTVRGVAFNPDGMVLASCSFDSTTAIWDTTENYDQVAILEGHENEVKCVAWSSSGELLATCSRDKSVWIWEVLGDGDFECCAVLHEHTQDVKYVKWHPSKEILASASYDDTIRIWKEEDGDWFCAQVLTGHTSTVWSIDFDQTGDYLVSVSDDLSLRLWKNKGDGYEQVFELPNLHSRTIYSVSWSHVHGLIATCGSDNRICIIEMGMDDELNVKEVIEQAHGECDVNYVAWCPLEEHCSLLGSCGDDGSIKIWE